MDNILITPLAKKLALKNNIDISKIKPNSRRIHTEDLDITKDQDNGILRLFISPLSKKYLLKNVGRAVKIIN